MTTSKVFPAALCFLATVAPVMASAQDRPERFQRREEPVQAPVTIFHSPQSANLFTAETLNRTEWQFEISHRFLPAISDGVSALWGIDGPANIRLGLAYAPTDDVMIGVLRSSFEDNLDLNAKVRVLEMPSESLPVMVALAGGVSWNDLGSAPSAPAENNEMQAWAQVIVNALLGDRLALGAVPSVLRNPRPADASASTTVSVGFNGQVYVNDGSSLFAEWILTEGQIGQPRDPITAGVELEVGGHFFKLLVTNAVLMNPSQYLAGAPFSFDPDEWRFGFNITRLLVF